MSVQVRWRRDTEAFLSTFTGAAGEILVDTTVNRIQVHNGAAAGGFPSPIALSVQNGGNTNNSNAGSGTDFDHNLTFTIPANFMRAQRLFRASAVVQLTSGTVPPTLTHKIKLGSTVIGANGGTVNILASQTNVGLCLQWIFQATQAPAAAANVQCSLLGSPSGLTVVQNENIIAMPVAVATNGALVCKITTLWSAAGTGTNTISLNQFILEALN